jgi:enoyl-CoA hydratase/carnithine racemase
MRTIDSNPFHNGPGSDAWFRSWTHLSVDRRRLGYCRVTFDHPPINTITATTVAELTEIVALIEQDPDLNVVVFDSSNPAFYLAHYDVANDPGRTAALGVGRTGMSAWIDVLVRLSRAPVVSIAAIRGRARGAGTDFVLACDLRFASHENTLLGQFEVGIGAIAGLACLAGRGRALEILLVADDLDGPRAEQYGFVNRVIADDQLDDEVDSIAGVRFHVRVPRDGDIDARGPRAVLRPGAWVRALGRPPAPSSPTCPTAALGRGARIWCRFAIPRRRQWRSSCRSRGATAGGDLSRPGALPSRLGGPVLRAPGRGACGFPVPFRPFRPTAPFASCPWRKP